MRERPGWDARRIRRRGIGALSLVVLAATGVPTAAAAAEAPREVTLQSSASQVTYGENATLTGAVTAPQGTPGACVVGTTVVIRGMGPTDVVPGPPPTSWSEKGRVTTDASGAFSFTFAPRSNASYVAHLPRQENPNCDEAVSSQVSISVRLRVELEVAERRVERGRFAKFTVRAEPYCANFRDSDVRLERLRFGTFETVAETESDEPEPCVVKFRQRIRSATTYRASSGPNCSIVCTHEEGTSRPIRVRVKRS